MALSGTVTPFSDMSKPGRKTKRKHQTSSPPNRKAKGGKSSEADCLICVEPILEADDHCTGDEAVFCEGTLCQIGSIF